MQRLFCDLGAKYFIMLGFHLDETGLDFHLVTPLFIIVRNTGALGAFKALD